MENEILKNRKTHIRETFQKWKIERMNDPYGGNFSKMKDWKLENPYKGNVSTMKRRKMKDFYEGAFQTWENTWKFL